MIAPLTFYWEVNMIVNHNSMIRWEQVQDKGKEVTAFYVKSLDDAKKLKDAINQKGREIYIMYGDDWDVIEDEVLEQQGKTVRKTIKRNPK